MRFCRFNWKRRGGAQRSWWTNKVTKRDIFSYGKNKKWRNTTALLVNNPHFHLLTCHHRTIWQMIFYMEEARSALPLRQRWFFRVITGAFPITEKAKQAFSWQRFWTIFYLTSIIISLYFSLNLTKKVNNDILTNLCHSDNWSYHLNALAINNKLITYNANKSLDEQVMQI